MQSFDALKAMGFDQAKVDAYFNYLKQAVTKFLAEEGLLDVMVADNKPSVDQLFHDHGAKLFALALEVQNQTLQMLKGTKYDEVPEKSRVFVAMGMSKEFLLNEVKLISEMLASIEMYKDTPLGKILLSRLSSKPE